MIFELPETSALQNESDVEQKLIYPLLISDPPLGLGHDHADISTKHSLRRFIIGKGSHQKNYFPDYVISKGGYPIIIIEAKTPGADLQEAFREARLYSAELNGQYPSGLNPASRIIATDGRLLYAGPADQTDPSVTLNISDIEVFNSIYSEFRNLVDSNYLGAAFQQLLPKIRPHRFWKPRKLVGGVSIQREEIGSNSFAATISADFSHIFNPLTMHDRDFIAERGYVSSKRRERYIEPIDRIIRASTPLSESRSKTIDDTSNPVEFVKILRSSRSLEHQVMLIVGSAGAGKTTFIDHLRTTALPKDVRSKTTWIHIDMNPAPISRSEIYNWLRSEIVEKCRAIEPKTDFDELDSIKNVYAEQVNKFRKGVGRLYESDKTLWNTKLAESLDVAINDKHLSAQNYAYYFSATRGKLLIIVLDNCDKRLRDEQLLMFEAAQWIQREFKGLVVLPIREETYDNHHSEPPLDTALKDLVFRIEPPLFQKILQKRVQLAIKQSSGGSGKQLRYELPNGMHVDYPASKQAFYLTSILRSVFEHEMQIRRLIVGLAGRNMRRAMEIFLEFCTSGHIGEDHILKMFQSEGSYVLPLNLVTTVLLRANLRFYDSERSYLKNIYSATEIDDKPAYFVRILLLQRLNELSNQTGVRRLKGYSQVKPLREELAKFGISKLIFFRELENLTRGFCINSEDFRTENLTDEDLVAIAPAGRVHLQISADPYYIAAIAEDTWYRHEATANSIANRIKDPSIHYSPRTVFYNAKSCLQELERVYITEKAAYDALHSDQRFSVLVDLTESVRKLNAFERSLVSPDWVGMDQVFVVGTVHSGTIAGIVSYGLFVDLAPGISGLAHESNIPNFSSRRNDFRKGQTISVEIVDIDHLNKRISLGSD